MKNQFALKIMALTGLMMVAGLLSACGGATPAPAPAAHTKVTLQLSWSHNFEFSPMYLAIEKGYYSQAGLDITLAPGGYVDNKAVDPVEEVTSGRADIGMIDAPRILAERQNGKKLVAFAVEYQRSPIAFVSRAEKNIVRPKDLEGKTVMLDQATALITLKALMAAQNVDVSKVNLVPRTDFTIGPIVNDQTDVMDSWVINENISLARAGVKINSILPSDYGIETYFNVFFATEDTIKNKPTMIKAFLGATLKGINDAIASPDSATTLVTKYDPKADLSLEQADMAASLPLLNPAGSKPGMMTDSTWKSTWQNMVDQKLLDPSTDATQAYTLEFLKGAYGN